ncbi:hypothetical protein B8W69_15670 [Mycobacterium vulneris]|uniref:Proline rich protein n=1 Tax=Mycolicibacterium vulneris TaxID=547163 RepID=A0A1X2KY58_9MYCO|nr:hypothetical protein [Mycolicibacterium vulneris]OSC26652.1 hypothetical protein B8W69_15670 [Mycolicibacterium vulneris]
MSETSETPTVRHSTATAPVAAEAAAAYRAPRVFQLAAWVAIVAGIVFIVAVIFFTGFILGHRGGHHGHHHHKHHHAMVHHRGPGGPGSFGGPGAPGGQGGQNGPGATSAPPATSGVRPSGMAPGQLPASVFHSAATAHGAPGQAPSVIVLTN